MNRGSTNWSSTPRAGSPWTSCSPPSTSTDPAWTSVDRDALADMIATSAKKRHEIDGDRIRALYGHSVPGRIERNAATPPAQLYHGTPSQAWESIQHDGLRPMRRQYVHLSADVATARLVGRRKAAAPIILAVDAQRAHSDGHRFWHGNELIWLAEHVPSPYLHDYMNEPR